MNFDLLHIWQSMDLFARLVVMTLVVMATFSFGVFLERLWVFARAKRSSRSFGDRARSHLANNDYVALYELSSHVGGSPLAELIGAGAMTYLAASERKQNKLPPVELTRRELLRRTEAIEADLRRGMNLLASVGSVAPFVGLLGTVVGIIASFQGIAREGSGGIGAISAGIAEALVVTALGLLVAIPAVLCFNYLSGKADALRLGLEQSRGEFLDHLESHAGDAVIPHPEVEPAVRGSSAVEPEASYGAA